MASSEAAVTVSDSRKAEVQAFDDSKTGVTKIPPMFHVKLDPPTESDSSNFSIPIIDLQHINKRSSSARHVEVLDKIRSACKEWGFFQVINHGIPVCVLDEMISGIKRFHEQDGDARMPFYSRDADRGVRYFSNGKLFKDMAANWRDTIAFVANPDPPNPQDMPAVCS